MPRSTPVAALALRGDVAADSLPSHRVRSAVTGGESVMHRIVDPDQIDHAKLRDFARWAAWVGKLDEAAAVLADLTQPPANELATDHDGRAEDHPLAVAHTVVEAELHAQDRDLEDELVAWLHADPAHWSTLKQLALDPWRDADGEWRADTPAWVRTLSRATAVANVPRDRRPSRRRATLRLVGRDPEPEG